MEVETHYAERLYQCFFPSTFLPCSKSQGRAQHSSARRPTTEDQISLCSLASFPSDTNRDMCFYRICYTSSCLSNHIASYLSIPLCPQGLPLFCLWDLMLSSFRKFCFMQLSFGKHTLSLSAVEAFKSISCVPYVFLRLYLPKLSIGFPGVYLKLLALTYQVSNYPFLA